jgi:hypothetical protein
MDLEALCTDDCTSHALLIVRPPPRHSWERKLTTPIFKTDLIVSERSFAAGQIEKLFPEGSESACLARPGLAKAANAQRENDDGYYLVRGLAAGTLMSVVSELFATTGTMLVDLGGELDRILMDRTYRRFDASVLARIRPEVIQMVRGWQERLGQGGEVDLTDTVSLLKPEHDLWVRREGRFRIRVRPDHVVGVGDLLVAQEWSTSKNPDSISLARFALNWHALFRERLRRPEWKRYTAIVTRVEMLSLGYGFTVRLEVDELEVWRLAIGAAAELCLSTRYGPL